MEGLDYATTSTSTDDGTSPTEIPFSEPERLLLTETALAIATPLKQDQYFTASQPAATAALPEETKLKNNHHAAIATCRRAASA